MAATVAGPSIDQFCHFSLEVAGGPKTHLYRHEDFIFQWRADASPGSNFSLLRDAAHRILMDACRDATIASPSTEGPTTTTIYEFLQQRQRSVRGVLSRAKWEVPPAPAQLQLYVKTRATIKYADLPLLETSTAYNTITSIIDNNKTLISKKNKQMEAQAVRDGVDPATIIKAYAIVPLYIKVWPRCSCLLRLLLTRCTSIADRA